MLTRLLILILFLAVPGVSPAKMIIQKFTAAAGGATIDDDFSSDSSGDYTSLLGTSTPKVTGGESLGTNDWGLSSAVHDTSTGSSGHYVQAVVEVAANCYSGLLFNVTPGATPATTATGYNLEVQTGLININGFTGGNPDNETWVETWDFTETWTAGDRHLIRVETSSGTLQLYIDWNDDLDFLDTGEDEGTKSDSTYSGSYIGLMYSHDDDVLTDCAIDDLEADSL